MDVYRILGLEINSTDWMYNNKIPMYITNTFTMKKANVSGIDCIMLIPYDELPNISNLEKQIDKIKSVENLPVFLKLDHLSNFRKTNLLSKKIPFILKKIWHIFLF